MKKRMKLTEKELAIGMWLYIKMMINKYNVYSMTYIKSLKRQYLSKHDYCDVWFNNSILCDKYLFAGFCSGCPLVAYNPAKICLYQQACGFILSNNGKYYQSKISHKFYRKTRLKACDKIIETIEKDIPDNYGGNDYDNDEDF